MVFPQRVKSKLRSTFVIHATPLHRLDKDDDDEKLEMSTLGKSASIKFKGSYAPYTYMQKCAIIIIIGVVAVEQFDNHVKKMHSDRDEHFENEYAVSHTFFLSLKLLLCLLATVDQ